MFWKWGKSPRSLAWRLTVWYTLSATAVPFIVSGILYSALDQAFDQEADESLRDSVQLFAAMLRSSGPARDVLKLEIEAEFQARQYARSFARVTDAKGNVLEETPGMSRTLPAEVFPLAPALDSELRPRDVQLRRPYRLLAARVAGGDQQYIIQIAYDRTHKYGILRRYRLYLYIVDGLALLCCALSSYLIARRGMRPVLQITAATSRIHSASLNQRLALPALPLELQELCGNFNAMLDRLEDAFRRLSQFSADIAHELRTPLGNLRGEVEVALGKARTPAEYREILGSTLEECERLSRLVDQLLFLARAENAAIKLKKQPLPIAAELSAVCDFYEAAASEAGVTLRVDAPEALEAALNRELFRSAVGNLVGNALASTRDGGQITLRAQQDGTAVQVEVSDTGSGIPPEHLAHLFDRFYRVDGARSRRAGGSGLGLSIVRSIAQLHGGTAEISSTVGQGTRVTLRLPRTAD